MLRLPPYCVTDVSTGEAEKTPTRVSENPTQGLGPPRLLGNSTKAFGKSHPGFWKNTQFARTV